jgi:hypothetical protein
MIPPGSREHQEYLRLIAPIFANSLFGLTIIRHRFGAGAPGLIFLHYPASPLRSAHAESRQNEEIGIGDIPNQALPGVRFLQNSAIHRAEDQPFSPPI